MLVFTYRKDTDTVSKTHHISFTIEGNTPEALLPLIAIDAGSYQISTLKNCKFSYLFRLLILKLEEKAKLTTGRMLVSHKNCSEKTPKGQLLNPGLH